MEPDEVSSAFAALDLSTGARRDLSADDWAERFLAIELSLLVPEQIRDMWAVARGVLLYGWFFYPLYALGEDQLRRVADAAVLLRYQQAGGPRNPTSDRWPDLKPRLDWLVAQGVINRRVAPRWDAIRNLRNYGSHASSARIEMPTEALRSLAVLAEEIDALYVGT
jgi:hypothetical protein